MQRLSGIPYSGPDIGGFQGNPSAELYLRWFQMATFLTFYRTHSSNNAGHRAPWTYGEPTLSIIRQFLQLRYRLLPYFYTLSWEASQKGYPPVRPVFWSSGDAPALRGTPCSRHQVTTSLGRRARGSISGATVEVPALWTGLL